MFRKTNHHGRSGEDFSEEIRTHIQNETERLIEEGMDPLDAAAAARRAFGNVTFGVEQFYESGRWMWFDHLKKDLRYAMRQILSTPVWTATVVMSLTLGIGVNTAIFSLADKALLRMIPVEKPEELVLLDWHGEFVGGGNGSGNLFSYPFFRDLRKANSVFVDVFARHPTDVHLSTGGDTELASAEIVSGSYFPALGVRPAIGRLFTDEDDLQPGASPVVVLSYDYWRNRLNSDPAVVGKRVLVNSFPMTVVGVCSQAFRGVDVGSVPVVWIPIMMKREATPDWDALLDRRQRWLHVFGRLKPGINAAQAKAQLQPWFKYYIEADTRLEGWPQVTPVQLREYLASSLDVLPAAQGRSDFRVEIRRPVLILVAASALILLLVCLNVANLSLAKALSRQRETALRAALGASRRRLLTGQFLESAVLAAAGGIGGALLAPLVSRGILSFLPRDSDGIALNAELDVRALLFAFAASALTTILFGVAPAFHAASVQPVSALKEQSTAVAGGFRLRRVLVVGQFALALILLIAAGLFTRTLENLRVQAAGFSTTNLLTFRVDALGDGYTYDQAKPLIRRLLTAIQDLPEVEQAGVARGELLNGGGWNNPVTIQSNNRTVTEDLAMDSISPGYFEALGAKVTRGRGFNDRDARFEGDDGGSSSAIVNEEFVKRYFPGVDPIGARVGIGDRPGTVTGTEVVGVVQTFHNFGIREPEPQIFFPLWEGGVSGGSFYIRTRGSSPRVAQSIRTAVHAVDPKLSILKLHTVDDQLDRRLANQRMLAVFAAAFAVLATLLAMIGLYGVLSFSAERRTREIGIRLALGAPRWAAGGLIMREAARLVLAGLAFAIPVSWALGRYIESQLFGIRPMDPATIAGAAGLLALVCLVASAIPARKAESVSPLVALRSE